MAGVAIATAALFSLLAFEGGYRQGLRQELDRLGAHVLVVPKGCPYDAASIALHGASWPCYLKAEYLAEVRATPGVATAAPALMSASYDQTGRQTVYVGIEPSMLALKRAWQIRGTFPKAGEVLAGSDAATRFGWQVGQEVHLAGLRQLPARVSGILAPAHGPDDAFVYLTLSDAQAWLGHPGELTHILVRLGDPNDLDRVVQQLRGCNAGLSMNVVPLAHLFRTIQSMLASTQLLLAGVSLVALLAAVTGVGNTLMMAIAERTREIGVLRALGASRAQVFQLFLLETVQVCLVGGLVGVSIAFVASRGVEGWLRSQLPFAPTDTLISFKPWLVFLCLGCSLMVGSVAGFIPACRAALLSPCLAMRKRGGQ